MISTTDIILASTLVSLGFPLKDLSKVDERRYAFVFAQDDQIDSVVEQFNNDKLLIEPKKFAYHFKTLKGRIFGANEYKEKGG